jgi:TonB family protein
VSIRLGENGVIVGRRLATGSGNRVLDKSVMQAVNSVTRISGLSSGFLKRYRVISVSFKIE